MHVRHTHTWSACANQCTHVFHTGGGGGGGSRCVRWQQQQQQQQRGQPRSRVGRHTRGRRLAAADTALSVRDANRAARRTGRMRHAWSARRRPPGGSSRRRTRTTGRRRTAPGPCSARRRTRRNGSRWHTGRRSRACHHADPGRTCATRHGQVTSGRRRRRRMPASPATLTRKGPALRWGT